MDSPKHPGAAAEAARHLAAGRLSLRAKLLLAALSACVTALLAAGAGEVYLRLAREHITPDTLRERALEYEATVFSRHAFPQMAQRKRATPSGAVEINPQGYRGHPFEIRKPAGVVRVIVLGGSAAFDMFAREGQDWPHLVEQELRARGYGQVEVINAGTPGHASFDSLGRFYSEMWMFHPDYVLVYHCWNDIKYFPRVTPEQSLLRLQQPAAPQGSGSRLVSNPFIYYSGPLDRLLSYSQIYVRLRSRYLQWRLGTPGVEGIAAGPAPDGAATYSPYGPRQYELALRLIVAAARQVGARPILATQARLLTPSNTAAEREKIAYEFVRLSHDALLSAFGNCDNAVRSVARADGVPVLDLSAMFTGRAPIFEDHVHTTAAGSQALAQATARFLQRIMAAR